MKCFRVIVMGLWGVLVMGCGAPREAGTLARQEVALLAATPADDAAVRDALSAQAEAWSSLATLVQRHDGFGTAVGADFIDVVQRTAALACRQRELIVQGRDDPALNRQNLEHLRELWADAARYLGD